MKKFLFLMLSLWALTACQGNRKEVRVLYWNIQDGMWADQGNDYVNFVDFVKSVDPDICVWCEAESRYRTDVHEKMTEREEFYLPYNWDILARRYGHEYAVLSGKRDGFPQVITSKFPIRLVKRMVGEGDIQVVHGAGLATIPLGRDSLHIVTVHTYPFAYEYGLKDPELQKESKKRGDGDRFRAKEVRYIVDHTLGENPENEKGLWMMLGDFNAIARSDNGHYGRPEDDTAFLTHDYVAAETVYQDAVGLKYPGEFQSTTLSGRRIDFVYCTPSLYEKIRNIRVLREGYPKNHRDSIAKPLCRPSDHLPILIDFAF